MGKHRHNSATRAFDALSVAAGYPSFNGVHGQ